MTLQAAMRAGLAVALILGPALGEGAPPAEPAASDPAPATLSPPPAGRAADLDFGEDFPAPHRPGPPPATAGSDGAVTRKPPRAGSGVRLASRAWVYWTAGAAAMAAGGAAWYLHWGRRPDPAPVRDDQVFTDEAD